MPAASIDYDPNMPTLEEEIAPQVRTMQVIVGGLAVSPIVFAGIVVLIGVRIGPEAAALMTKLALVIGLVLLFVQQFAGRLVCQQAVNGLVKRSEEDPAALAGAYLSGLLVSTGICEAGAFINLIAFMVTREPITLAMAALLVLATLVRFPTLSTVANWARDRQRRLRERRDLATS